MSIFRKGEKIICTSTRGALHVTLNKAYIVVEEHVDYVAIINDCGNNSIYVDYRFENITKHRKEKLEKLIKKVKCGLILVT